MILRLGSDIVDLGKATTVTPLAPTVVQADERTASGKPYTVTWSYYVDKGWKFSYSWMTETILAELVNFHLNIAEAKKNIFEVDLDNGTAEINCRFISNPINVGVQQMRIVAGVWQPTYKQVNFDIEQVLG